MQEFTKLINELENKQFMKLVKDWIHENDLIDMLEELSDEIKSDIIKELK